MYTIVYLVLRKNEIICRLRHFYSPTTSLLTRRKYDKVMAVARQARPIPSKARQMSVERRRHRGPAGSSSGERSESDIVKVFR